MKNRKKGFINRSQGALPPEPPGIFCIRAYRKDDKRKDDNPAVAGSSSFRISARRGARGASPQSPILRPSKDKSNGNKMGCKGHRTKVKKTIIGY